MHSYDLKGFSWKFFVLLLLLVLGLHLAIYLAPLLESRLLPLVFLSFFFLFLLGERERGKIGSFKPFFWLGKKKNVDNVDNKIPWK